MVTKGLNKITQNETQDLQLVDNFCKSWDLKKKKKYNFRDKKSSHRLLVKWCPGSESNRHGSISSEGF